MEERSVGIADPEAMPVFAGRRRDQRAAIAPHETGDVVETLGAQTDMVEALGRRTAPQDDLRAGVARTPQQRVIAVAHGVQTGAAIKGDARIDVGDIEGDRRKTENGHEGSFDRGGDRGGVRSAGHDRWG